MGALARRLRIFRVGAEMAGRMFLAQYPPGIYFGSWVPRILFQTAFFTLFARYLGGRDYMAYAFVGNAVQVSTLPSVAMLLTVIAYDRASGTLPLLLASPADQAFNLLGRCAFYGLNGLLATLIAFLAVGPLLGVGLEAAELARVVPLWSLSLTGLGVLLGSLTLMTRADIFIANTACYLLMVLAGVNVPLSTLPPVLAAVGRLLPMTHGLEAIRALLPGPAGGWHAAAGAAAAGLGAKVACLALREAAAGLAYLACGWAALQLLAVRARRLGTLEFH
ncbi:MAG: ABC transporter permease [Acetobacteraceae bacterium]|nr:ABC transporter permease [Acetobacteraceae bacterium]